jgi:hypothetical protein
MISLEVLITVYLVGDDQQAVPVSKTTDEGVEVVFPAEGQEGGGGAHLQLDDVRVPK